MKNKFHTIIFIFSIVGLIISVGLFIYSFNVIKSSANKTGEGLTKIDQVNQKNLELNTIKKTIIATEEDRNKLAAYFVSDKSIVGFLEYIESLGETTNTEASIEAVDIGVETNTLIVSVKTIGTFSSVMRYVDLVENMPYRIEINNFTLTTKDSLSDTVLVVPEWEADITFKLISYLPS